jgi:hypothetical protein
MATSASLVAASPMEAPASADDGYAADADATAVRSASDG